MGPGAVRLTDGKGKKENQPENDLEVLQKHLHASCQITKSKSFVA